MSKSRYLSAQEAAAELGISLATLYAYVSRGLLRSEEGDDSRRTRRYLAEDVERLKARKEGRRSPEDAVEASLHFGLPVLESAITLIDRGKLYYRGHDATRLAEAASVEQVAGLIWTGHMEQGGALFTTAQHPAAARVRQAQALLVDLRAIDRFCVALPLAASVDLAAYDLRPAAVTAAGARILTLLVQLAGDEKTGGDGVAARLAAGWGVNDPDAGRLISAALILCADHELNISAFTARVVASGGATPYQVVSAGLAALQGYKHGGHTARVEALLREIKQPSNARAVLVERLKRGEALPGFGHTLYPDGDPRAAYLLERLSQYAPRSEVLRLAQAVCSEAETLFGQHPTIDLALVTLAGALRLPDGAALAVFAIGRTIGWIGHALEQYADDKMIRPRARYVGKQGSDTAL
ncbi:MAG: citrate synthase family protein [Anaerolineae bacterium]|nr:citrate synthase family protein [Anaerolineae bacterium]